MTAARLLAHSGWEVEVAGPVPTSTRWVTLSARTVQLINDIWDSDIVTAATHYRLASRRVIWDTDAAAEVLEPLVALESSSLAATMLEKFSREHLGSVSSGSTLSAQEPTPARSAQFVIDARGRNSNFPRRYSGRRQMRVWEPISIDHGAAEFAEMHAGIGYWCFLFPLGSKQLCLQIATPEPEISGTLSEKIKNDASDHSLLAKLVEKVPDLFDLATSVIPIAPSFHTQPIRASRLPVGDALMTLDPLCGDGVGHGVKSAILAVAVANSAAVTVSTEDALKHFELRTTRAFASHLKHCRGYYSKIRHAAPWEGEVESIAQAMEKLTTSNRDEGSTLLVLEDPDAGHSAKNVCHVKRPYLKQA